MTQNFETKSFLLTVSVKGDLSIECEEALVKYLRKNTLMHHVVIEHGASGKRHLHACFIFKRSQHRHKVENNLHERFVKPFHADSPQRFATKVQVCPGNDWYTSYLVKEQDVQVLSSTWDPATAVAHFPTQQVQEALQAKSKMASVSSPHIEKRVAEWIASSFENSPEGSLRFLKHCMYVDKSMIPIADPRKLTEKAFMHYQYRNGVTDPTERELWLLKQLQEGPSYDGSVCHHPVGNPTGSQKLWSEKVFKDT